MDSRGYEMNKREVTTRELIVAIRRKSKSFRSSSRFVALAIKAGKPASFYAPVLERRNGRLHPISSQGRANGCAVVNFIRDNTLDSAAVTRVSIELCKKDTVVALALGENQGEGRGFVDAGGMQLGRQTAARAAQSLIHTVFWGTGRRGRHRYARAIDKELERRRCGAWLQHLP